MDLIIRIITKLGDAAFAVLSIFSPVAALWIISGLTGVGMLLIWRYTSNQPAIADVRNKIAANLLAARLFKDELSVTFRAQRQIIWQAIRLLGLSLRPMAVMFVPFVLMMAQIGLRFEYRPIPVGQRTRIQVTVKQGAKVNGIGAMLQVPDGVKVDANDPCRVQPLRTIDWRITPTRPGDYTLVFGDGADRIEMPLCAGAGFRRISTVRGGSLVGRLLYSTERSIPESSVFEAIRIYYPKRSTPIFGLQVHWLITLLVLSIISALLFKPFTKTHI